MKSTSVLILLCALPVAYSQDNVDWAIYLGDKSASHYSEIGQINRENASQLGVAWTYRSGEPGSAGNSQIQCNPLIVGGTLYGTSPELHLFALDATTGKELWRFDPFRGTDDPSRMGVNRGLVYWENGEDKRILFGAHRYLHAINAKTGEPIEAFGEKGKVNLEDDLGRDMSGLFAISNTPGVVFENLIIIGMMVAEGPGPAAPGHIRAYDARSGELVWRFNTIPQPGEYGYDTWPEGAHERAGGANVWSGMTVDEERGLVFCPTGSAAFDFWGGNRLGDNLFANCLLALNARTGERVWHYQFVRHDLWDRDLPASPNLVTIERNGECIPAVAQITKSGHVFVFHRETGEPLFPIEEVPTPWSDLKGERTSPTQPLPTKPEPFARQVFTVEEITDISPESHRAVLDRFVTLRPHTPFMPPSREGTLIFPGFDGGGEWGGAAVDPNGILYVNSNEMAWILTMVDIAESGSGGAQMYLQNCAGCHGADKKGSAAHGVTVPSLIDLANRKTEEEVRKLLVAGQGVMPSFGFLSEDQRNEIIAYLFSGDDENRPESSERLLQSGYPYTHTGYVRFQDPEGYPAVKPPWGTLNAIDLNTGEYLWRKRLGEFPELTARGIPKTGAENYGGPIVTAGGILFIGATADQMFRVLDTRTGNMLWETELPAGGYATPATYMIDGRQFVVIACGGGKMGTPSGDAYVAFALPE